MILNDIKRKTKDAYTMECVYRSANHGDTACFSDKCFYWNDLDTHVVKTNESFRETVIMYPESQDKISYYRIHNGKLQYITIDKFKETEEIKVIEKQQEFFKTLKDRTKIDTSNIFFDKEEQLFYTRQKREDRIGYCMKVAKELNLI